jgi:ACS family pantothenate transporter-like MFS transporter
MVMVVSTSNRDLYGATFTGYMLNAASWGFWPVLYAWCNEICHRDAEERAIVIAVAQTMGQMFIAWVPLLILNVGKYAPAFTMGFGVMAGVSVLEFAMVFVLRALVKWEQKEISRKEQFMPPLSDHPELK